MAQTGLLRDGRWLEVILAGVMIGALIYNVQSTLTHGYYPQPFFYEPSDTFADWFNPAYWARNAGVYDTWNSLYPPLSFVFLRVFGLDYCYPVGRSYDASIGLAARSCDWVGIVSIVGLYLGDILIAYLSFRRIDRSRAPMRALCFGLGFPLMNGLERGNLVLITITCVMLGFGPLVRSSRLKAMLAGLAVNFKVYLIAAIVPLLIKRRWSWVEQAVLASVIIYLVTFALLGRGNPVEIMANIMAFSDAPSVNPLDLWSAATIIPALKLLDSPSFPIIYVLGSHAIAVLKLVLPVLLHGTQGLIIIAALLAALRPEAVTPYRVITLGILLALVTSESGGYSPVYYMFFVLMEPWRGTGRKVAVLLCYLIAVPLEIRIATIAPAVRDSYIGGTSTVVQYYLGLTPFLRPLVTLAVAITIALTTFVDVWTDIQIQGWSARWRFRRDVPFLPWVRRPLSPCPLTLPTDPVATTLQDQ
jgi:hypothetical protein